MTRPLSVQLYTVRDLIAENRDDVLRQIADLGFKSVEPFQPTLDPIGFRKVADLHHAKERCPLFVEGVDLVAVADQQPDGVEIAREPGGP